VVEGHGGRLGGRGAQGGAEGVYAGCRKWRRAPGTIGAAYEKKADPLIRAQLEKAGARGAVLNSALQ